MADESKAKLLRDAEKYVLQGKIPQAIAEYLKVTKSDPNDVLILNTIGDLYLRLGKVTEANTYFAQVAENYARNNFFLKAIAVYRKILNAAPEDLDTSLTLASLYFKQGLNVDARNLYLRIAGLRAEQGRTRESVEAYEKVVEIDPQTHAIQLKLAEIHLAEGSNEKAQAYFAGAARAQVKAGDLAAAVRSFERALHLNPLDVEVMKSFLDACIQAGNVAPALEQLNSSLAQVPDSQELREILCQACLANKDPEGALQAITPVLSQDESRYPEVFPVSKAFVEAGQCDRAADCLDFVVPVLIRKRETDKAVAAYSVILEKEPEHIPTLVKLAGICSATNDQPRYLDVLDRIVNCHVSCHNSREALEYLEKILAITPTSERHLNLHREVFADAYPGAPYTAPVSPEEPSSREVSGYEGPGQSANPAIVEVDLLMNYGMRDKAVVMLQSLVAQDPTDKDIHIRLANVYKEDMNNAKAAEECLLLAALYRRANNEETALKYLTEAQTLCPDLVTPQLDLTAFARAHGLVSFAEPGSLQLEASPSTELDLSGDLSSMFFKDFAEPEADEGEPSPEVESAAAEFMQGIPLKPPTDSVQEQLQEVDFYIRLGFFDEARAKLDEIARAHPDDPELPPRYRQLSEGGGSSQAPERAEEAPAAALGAFRLDVSSDDEADRLVGSRPTDVPHVAVSEAQEISRAESFEAAKVADRTWEKPPAPPPADSGAAAGPPVNAMFADVLEEVNDLTDHEIAREEFDTHFSLGVAYREMALVEDAIKEFQTAYKALNPVKFPKEAIQCCGMLSTCFLEKEMPRSALRWCQAGLEVSGLSSYEDLALRYDMGVAHSILGDVGKALECFDRIYAVDPSYRDVAQKIDSLRGGSDRHVP